MSILTKVFPFSIVKLRQCTKIFAKGKDEKDTIAPSSSEIAIKHRNENNSRRCKKPSTIIYWINELLPIKDNFARQPAAHSIEARLEVINFVMVSDDRRYIEARLDH